MTQLLPARHLSPQVLWQLIVIAQILTCERPSCRHHQGQLTNSEPVELNPVTTDVSGSFQLVPFLIQAFAAVPIVFPLSLRAHNQVLSTSAALLPHRVDNYAN
eukprot:Filipodium_phascolosomae@DN2525_c0_g1_i7.p1